MVYVRVLVALFLIAGLFVLVLFGVQNSLWEVTLRLDLGMAAWDVGPVRVLYLVLGAFGTGLGAGLGIWAAMSSSRSARARARPVLDDGGASW